MAVREPGLGGAYVHEPWIIERTLAARKHGWAVGMLVDTSPRTSARITSAAGSNRTFHLLGSANQEAGGASVAWISTVTEPLLFG